MTAELEHFLTCAKHGYEPTASSGEYHARVLAETVLAHAGYLDDQAFAGLMDFIRKRSRTTTPDLLDDLREVISEAIVEIYNLDGPRNVVIDRLKRVRARLENEVVLADAQGVTP